MYSKSSSEQNKSEKSDTKNGGGADVEVEPSSGFRTSTRHTTRKKHHKRYDTSTFSDVPIEYNDAVQNARRFLESDDDSDASIISNVEQEQTEEPATTSTPKTTSKFVMSFLRGTPSSSSDEDSPKASKNTTQTNSSRSLGSTTTSSSSSMKKTGSKGRVVTIAGRKKNKKTAPEPPIDYNRNICPRKNSGDILDMAASLESLEPPSKLERTKEYCADLFWDCSMFLRKHPVLVKILYLILMILGASLGVFFYIQMKRNYAAPISPNNTNTAGSSPVVVDLNESISKRYDAIRVKVVASGVSLEEDVDRKDSPQHRAIDWLSQKNETDRDMKNNPYFLERYALAVLFFENYITTYDDDMLPTSPSEIDMEMEAFIKAMYDQTPHTTALQFLKEGDDNQRLRHRRHHQVRRLESVITSMALRESTMEV